MEKKKGIVSRLNFYQTNNYIKRKTSKKSNEKLEIVRLDRTGRPISVLLI